MLDDWLKTNGRAWFLDELWRIGWKQSGTGFAVQEKNFPVLGQHWWLLIVAAPKRTIKGTYTQPTAKEKLYPFCQ